MKNTKLEELKNKAIEAIGNEAFQDLKVELERAAIGPLEKLKALSVTLVGGLLIAAMTAFGVSAENQLSAVSDVCKATIEQAEENVSDTDSQQVDTDVAEKVDVG